MIKSKLRLFGWAVGLSLALGAVGAVAAGTFQKGQVEVRAASATEQTMTWSNISSSNRYGLPTTETDTDTEYTDGTHGLTLNAKKLKVSSSYFMVYGASGFLYNSTPINGYITSVTVTFNTGSVSTAATCAIGLGTSAGSGLSGHSKTTTQSAGGTATNATGVTVSNKYRYFSIGSTKSSKNLQITQIAVKYEPLYSVTYDKNSASASGSMSDSDSPYLVGSSVTVLENSFTAPSGYFFRNWNTKANGTGTSYSGGASFSISANTTLYAQWQELSDDPYVITDSSQSGFTGQTPVIGFSFGNFESLVIEAQEEGVFTVGTIDSADPDHSTVQLNYLYVGNTNLLFKDGSTLVKSVSINVEQTTISGLPENATVALGETLNLGSLISVNVGTVSWDSSDKEKATVTSAGVITPVAVGQTSIVVQSSVDARVSATCALTVIKPKPSIADEITRSDLDFGSSTGYSNFTAADSSAAIYVGQAFQTANSYIQIRTSGSCEGLVTTKTGGKSVKSITLDFNKSSNNIQIYGSNTAYSGSNAAQLFDDSTKGDLLTTISYSDSPVEYVFDSDYKYVGIRSASGAAYLDSISIVWNLYSADEVASQIKNLAGGWSNDVATSDCESHYASAKGMILYMSPTELEEFKTSEDTEIAAARTTYEWWCHINSDDSPWSGAIKTAGAHAINIGPKTIDGHTTPLLVAAFAGIGALAVGGMVFLRKRKEF